MTSGTSGQPLAFAYDVGSEYFRQATKLRGYGWAGYRPGDRSLHFWGSIGAVHRLRLKAQVKSALDRLMRREHYIDCADRSEEALTRVVHQLRDLRPKVIVCYAQAGAALARHIIETKSRDWKDIAVISAAERLFPADREVMAEAFGPGIFETYGSREVMLIAAECSAHQGLHVSMENLVIEVIVREGNAERPALPGELGEVVVTDLHNYGAPFIRYLNGDLASMLPPGRCACGRALSRLQAVEGRATDTLRDGAGRPVGGMFFVVLFSVLAHKVRAFQVIQRVDRSIDVKLVPGKRVRRLACRDGEAKVRKGDSRRSRSHRGRSRDSPGARRKAARRGRGELKPDGLRRATAVRRTTSGRRHGLDSGSPTALGPRRSQASSGGSDVDWLHRQHSVGARYPNSRRHAEGGGRIRGAESGDRSRVGVTAGHSPPQLRVHLRPLSPEDERQHILQSARISRVLRLVSAREPRCGSLHRTVEPLLRHRAYTAGRGRRERTPPGLWGVSVRDCR